MKSKLARRNDEADDDKFAHIEKQLNRLSHCLEKETLVELDSKYIVFSPFDSKDYKEKTETSGSSASNYVPVRMQKVIEVPSGCCG